MVRILALCLCMFLSSAVMPMAGQAVMDEPVASHPTASGSKGSEAREMSGMSIVGNDEAPKSLYIVPWNSSQIGGETSLDTMLNDDDMPVDREVFKRQIEFYQLSTRK